MIYTNKQKTKKSQEEMVGFVLIMVIVAIIWLILLFFFISKPSTKLESAEVNKFLRASMDYTTNCSVSYESNFLSLREIVSSCYLQKNCLNGEPSCSLLNKTFSEILRISWLKSDMRARGYEFRIFSTRNASINSENNILSLSFGNKTGEKTGGEEVISKEGGNIVVRLELYLNKEE